MLLTLLTSLNIRAFTTYWTSTPSLTVPNVYAYAANTSSSPRIYVSWNSATTVARWSLYRAQTWTDEPVLIGSTVKEGFETNWIALVFYP